MNVPAAVRLPFRFDAAALAADVAALPNDVWEPHFNTQQYDGDWSGVPLRVAAGAALALYPDPTSDHFEDTQLLRRCPSVVAALAKLRCPLQTVRFLRLGPGSRITEHRDHRLAHADGEVRLHVPVTTGPHVEFRVAGSPIAMAPGEVWYLDLSERHSVANTGADPRVHLVIDCVVDAWLTAQLNAGWAPHAE
jgi:Aspartyl/Asparaginyl beta-hydroxylase